MAAELKRHNIDIAWTGHKNGDSLYTEFWYPNVTNSEHVYFAIASRISYHSVIQTCMFFYQNTKMCT